MSNEFARTARRFFSPEAIVPFLFGSVALGVLSNAVFTVCTNQFGTDTSSLLLIGVGSLLILALAVWVVTRLVRPTNEPTSLPGKRAPAKRKGLIVLVSRKPPCEKAIEFHRPVLERVWLICSTQSLPVAQELRSQYPALAGTEPRVINDVNDPLDFCAVVDGIYRTLPNGWTAEDVIADYVGMTAHGSVGVVLACLNRGRPMQFTPAKYDEKLQPVGPLDPIEITFDGFPKTPSE